MTTFAHVIGCLSSKASLNVLLKGKPNRLEKKYIEVGKIIRIHQYT